MPKTRPDERPRRSPDEHEHDDDVHLRETPSDSLKAEYAPTAMKPPVPSETWPA